jgi:hypothetical protein
MSAPAGEPLSVWYETRWRPGSDEMRAAVAALASDIERHESAAGSRRRRRRPADADAFLREVAILLCNVGALRLAGADGARLAIGRGHTSLHGSKTRRRLLDAAEAAGLLALTERGYARSDGTRMASRWVATESLRAYLPQRLTLNGLHLAPGTRVGAEIRDDDGNPQPLPPDALHLGEQMESINGWLRTLRVSVAGGSVWLTRPDGTRRLAAVTSARHLALMRVFDGSLERGGRLYGGFWINQPKAWRFANLELEGEPIAECDFREVHLRLAYRRHGIAWPFDADAYTAGSGARAGWKRMTNAMLQAARPLRQWPGGTREERLEHRAYFPEGTKPSAVVAAIRHRHVALAARGAFESGLGAYLTRTESDITTALMLECRRLELPSLPLHDCMIVPASRAAQAAELMTSVARRITGAELPVGITEKLRVRDGGGSEATDSPSPGQSVPVGTVPA